ncbi:unnamed protein product [Dicrocoelium dendriticum]|nr:unnamed protein product [Dicrocoelium dendriticum]
MGSPDIDGLIWTVLKTIEEQQDEKRVLETLSNLNSLFHCCNTICNISVKTIEQIVRLLSGLLRNEDLLQVQLVCIDILRHVLNSNCHHSLKNRVMLSLERELESLFVQGDPQIQQAIWECLNTHLVTTGNLGPTLKIFISRVLYGGENDVFLKRAVETIHKIFECFPTAQLAQEDVLIVVMCLLEHDGKRLQRRDSLSGAYCLEAIRRHLSEDELTSVMKALPINLQTTYEMLQSFGASNPISPSQHSCGPTRNEDDYDQPWHTDVQDVVPYAHPVYSMHQLIPKHLSANLSTQQSNRCRESAANLLKMHYMQKFYTQDSRERAYFIESVQQHLPTLLKTFSQFLMDNKDPVTYHLLEAIQVSDYYLTWIVQSAVERLEK